jgi:curli biogenesis system outer membrane secretion channel CsgG
MFKIKINFKFVIIFILFIIYAANVTLAQEEDLDTAIENLAAKISQHMAEKEKTKIAIIPFQNLTTDAVSTLGKYIAEELTTALFNSGKFQIIERNLLTWKIHEKGCFPS